MIVWSISEYAAKGCLFDYLTNNKLHFDQILRWSTDIALGKWLTEVIWSIPIIIYFCTCIYDIITCSILVI